MRKLLIVSVAVLAGIALVIALIPPIFESQIAAAIRRQINADLDAEVGFGDAHLSLWRHFPDFTASLDNFVIAGKNEFLGDTLVKAERLSLVLHSGRFLFGDEIEIRHLELGKPEVYVSVLHSGKANYLISHSAPSDTVTHVRLSIDSWEIAEGRLVYRDLANDVHVKSDMLNLNGMIDINDDITNISLAGVAANLWLTHSGKDYMEEKNVSFMLDGSYDRRKDQLKFSENRLSINNLDLDFSGSLEFRGEDTGIDLKVKTGEAEFSDILSLSKVLSRDFDKMNIQGRMTLDAQFLGVLNSEADRFPAFKANLVVSEGSIKYNARQSSLNEINFDLAAFNTDGRLENTIVNLLYFGMNVGENPVYGSAQIEGFRQGRVSADMLARFPLEELAAIYPMEGIEMKGDLSFELKANGPYTGSFSALADVQNWRTSRIPSFHLGIALTGGNIRYSHLPDTIRNVNLTLRADNQTGWVDDTKVDIDELEGMLGDNPVKGHLSFEGLREPLVKGSLRAGLNLDELKDFYPLDHLTLKGKVEIDVTADGRWSTEQKLFPEVQATVNIRDGFVKSDSYPWPMEDTQLALRAINETGKFADTKFFIDSLSYSIENEMFVVSGSVDDLERYNYDLDITGILYLDKIQRIFALDGLSMSGEVDIALAASGNLADLREKRYHRLPAAGQVTVRNVYFKNKWVPHGLRISEGHLNFTNERIVLDTLHGSVGASAFNLTGHFHNYLAFIFHNDEPIRGDLLFESGNFDINELLVEHGRVKDTVHHELAARRLPANIDFTFDSKISQLHYKNLLLTDLDGEIVLRNGVLTLNKMNFDAMDASFSVSGDYDPRDPRHPLFDIELGIHELDINKAHEAFATVQAIAPAAEHTYGIFSVDYALKGTLTHNLFPVFESLRGEGTVRIRDAMVNGMKLFHHISGLTKKEELMNPKLKDIVMEIAVSDGVANVKPFNMKLAGFDTEITGRHELTGNMNYLLKIALPPFDLVKIPLHVDGTYDNPRVHIGKGHEENLRKAIAQPASGDAGSH